MPQAVPPVFRFAPSPNGLLHLGHAYSALLNEHLARQAGGRLLLRIEDIDRTRCRPGFEAALLEDLDWLGVAFEPGPRRQSGQESSYRAALGRLAEAGLLRPSAASRREVGEAVARAAADTGRPWPRDPDGAPLHPVAGLDQDADPTAPHALRLDMARALAGVPPLAWDETGAGPEGQTGMVPADPARWGDAVLSRKEFTGSYHLAVVVDDAAQGVTHVVRGADLFHATALHRLLQHHLGAPAPVYHHHALLRDEAGAKLSKSLASRPLREFRREGWTAAAIRGRLGFQP